MRSKTGNWESSIRRRFPLFAKEKKISTDQDTFMIPMAFVHRRSDCQPLFVSKYHYLTSFDRHLHNGVHVII